MTGGTSSWNTSRGAILLLLLAFGVGVPWALSSPPGAGPDDDFHLMSTWCAGGPMGATCSAGETPAARLVPRSLVEVADCYRFDASVSAACQPQTLDWDDPTLVSTERLNTDGLYPPVFYRSMNLLVTDSPIKSILAMRVFTIALGVALFSAVFWTSPDGLRQTLAASWLLGLFPLGVFLVTSNNPSGWAVIGIGTFWAAFLNVLEPSERGSPQLRALLVLATAAVAAGSRADAAVYIVISIAAVLAVSSNWTSALPSRARRSSWLVPALLIIVCGFSLLAFLTASQGDVTTSGFSSGPERTISYLITYNLRHLHVLHLGMIGVSWGLGWLDTPMPAIVGRLVGSITLIGSVWGLLRSDRRKIAAVVMAFSAMVVIPLAILVRSSHVVPEAVQPRYLFPLYFLLLGLVLLPADRRPRALPIWVRLVVAAVFGTVNSVALHVNLRRYLTGLDEGGFNLNAGREWWWPGLPAPMLFWLISSISMFLLALAAMSLFRVEHTTSSNTAEAV